MIYKLTMQSEDEFDHPCGYRWGSRPEGEIEQTPYSHLRRYFANETPNFIATNQIQGNDAKELGKGFISATIYYFHDFCIVVPDSGDVMYRIAPCLHDMEHNKNLGNCYNQYKCTKCGKTRNIDSSD